MGLINDYLGKRVQKVLDEMPIDEFNSIRLSKEETAQLLEPVNKEDSTILNTPQIGGSRKMGLTRGQKMELRSKPGNFTHKSRIIANKAYNCANPDHRNIVHDTNSIYSTARNKIVKAVTAVEPQFFHYQPDVKEDDEEDLKPFKKCHKVWKERQGQRAFKKALWKSVAHGGIIYEPLNMSKLGPWYTATNFFIRTFDEALVLKTQYGFPYLWEINPSNDSITNYTINLKKWGEDSKLPIDPTEPENEPETSMEDIEKNANSGFWFDPFDDDDHQPHPWFFGSWDNAIDYEIIREARNSYDQKLGNGFIVVGIPASEYNKVKDQVKKKIANIRNEVGLVVPTSKDEPFAVEWNGAAANRVDFNADLEDIRKDIIANIEFPMRWFFGDSEGAMESSGKDRYQVHDSIKYVFNVWKRFIKLFLLYHKAIQNIDDVYVKAPYELQLTEMEKVEVEDLKVTTIMMKAPVLTTDEIRQELGYDPMTDEQKQEMMETQEMMNPEDDQEDNEQNDEPEPKKQDSKEFNLDDFKKLDTIVKKCDYNLLEDILGPSRATIGKIKDTMKSHKRSVIKCDSYTCKTDSISLGDGKYMIEDALLVPVQEEYYESLGYKSIRSYDELKKYMDNDTNPKEFRIGVNSIDDHTSKVSMEISESEAVGKVKYENIQEDGIHGPIIYDLNRTKNILKDSDWIADKTYKKEKLQTSVALRSIDIPIKKGTKYEINHDFRSHVFTRRPRNKDAGGE